MTNQTTRSVKRWVPALAWASLIFISSSIPGKNLPATGLAPLAHFVEYAVLGGLIVLALGVDKKRVPLLLLAITLATLYGVADEYHQSFVPGRTPDVMDVLVDLLGAAAGASSAPRFAERASEFLEKRRRG